MAVQYVSGISRHSVSLQSDTYRIITGMAHQSKDFRLDLSVTGTITIRDLFDGLHGTGGNPDRHELQSQFGTGRIVCRISTSPRRALYCTRSLTAKALYPNLTRESVSGIACRAASGWVIGRHPQFQRHAER
jgi:hypothetical protein